MIGVRYLGDLELLLLGHRQEQVAELGGVLEELDRFEHAAVRLRELAGPVERQRMRVRPVRLDRLKSRPPVSCSMLIDLGSPGSNVAIPMRLASEK
jgi:hypothetical protein